MATRGQARQQAASAAARRRKGKRTVSEGVAPCRAPLDGDAVFDETVDHCRHLFQAGRPIVGICAAGILIRLVAPLLSDKQAEPPVLVMTETGDFVPLLGGHHGANRLARDLAEAANGFALVSTATDALLGAPLGRCSAPDQRVVMVVDALDECEQEGGARPGNRVLDVIAKKFPKLPKWLGVLVTTRPDTPIRIGVNRGILPGSKRRTQLRPADGD